MKKHENVTYNQKEKKSRETVQKWQKIIKLEDNDFMISYYKYTQYAQ